MGRNNNATTYAPALAAQHQQPQGYYNYYNYGGQMSQLPHMYNAGAPPAPAMPSYPGYYGAASSVPPPPLPSRKRTREGGEEAPVSSYRCSPCNLNLDSASALAAHQNSHITCTACSFVGAPKVVKGHFQAVHGKFSGSGYKTVNVAVPGCRVQRFRICVGNRPEDVQRWIAERRKRFPRKKPLPPPEAVKPEGLSNLLDGYSSSEDEKDKSEKPKKEEEASADAKANDGTPNELPQPNKKPCHSFMRHGQCRRGDACPYSHEGNLRQPQQQRNTSLKRRAVKRPTLLSDLLKADADRETKLSLQLIHYIVHSDFLKKRM